MFKKVLLAEDFDVINIGLLQALNELGIKDIDHTKYCDEALLKARKALADDLPFDLLISDLSFDPDHREARITSGEELIRQIKLIQPNIKIIAYSVEDKSFRIKSLCDKVQVNSYIIKGRESIGQLKAAITKLSEGSDVYFPNDVQNLLKNKESHEIDDYDIKIIRQLALGVTQDNMEARFKELGITPNSKSAIEKRISKLKDYFGANNTVHLIAIAKDLGLI